MLTYVDDVDLIAETQAIINIVTLDCARRIRSNIYYGKTKALCSCRRHETENLMIGEASEVNGLKYLGTTLTNVILMGIEIDSRIAAAIGCYYSLLSNLKLKSILRNI